MLPYFFDGQVFKAVLLHLSIKMYIIVSQTFRVGYCGRLCTPGQGWVCSQGAETLRKFQGGS